MLKHKKGALPLTAIVGTLIVVAVMLFIAVKVTAEVGDSIDRSGFSTSQNSTYDNITDTSFDSFDLTTVALIVLAASGILMIVFTLARG